MAKKEDYELRFKESASPEEMSIILEGINVESAEAKEMGKIIPFAYLIKDSTGKTLAGITGTTLYGCLDIDALWVHPEFRKKDWEKQLVHEAEKLGKKRGCTFASVATMDWEARPFYEKLGYTLEYTREGFEKESKMHILRKPL